MSERGRVLVTGAGGLLGAAVVRALSAGGTDVLAHLGPPGAAGAVLPDGVATAVAEITDEAAVSALVSRVDAVVHLAGPPSVAASFAAPRAYALAHVVGTATVLEACRAAGVRRLVHVSSAEVYAPSAGPVREDAPRRPRSPYGAAKLGAESLVLTATGVPTVVLRPFSVWGPASPPHSLVGRVLRQVAGADRVELASLAPVRDLVHVDDVAAAVLAALDVPAPEPFAVNVGSGVGTSVAELARLAVAAGGRALPVVEAPVPDRPASADVPVLVADVSRARERLGWCARVPLEDGLRAALAEVRA